MNYDDKLAQVLTNLLAMVEDLQKSAEAQISFNNSVLTFMAQVGTNTETFSDMITQTLELGTDTMKHLCELAKVVIDLEQDVAIRKTIVAEPVKWLN